MILINPICVLWKELSWIRCDINIDFQLVQLEKQWVFGQGLQ